MISKKLKDIKNFSLIVIPSLGGIHTKTYSLNFSKIILYLLVYTLLVAFIVTGIYYVTPIKAIFFDTDSEIAEQNRKIIDLNGKVILLTRELENISRLNTSLKSAILMADSTAFDKTNLPKDSIKQFNTGGNLFYIFSKIFMQDSLETVKDTPFFISPINSSFISKDFNSYRGHLGMDFVVKKGTPVKAAAGGYVISADYTVNDGYKIILSHPMGFITVYKHCSALTKKTRDHITQGEIIALSGNSGKNTTGPHLHFEIWQNGQVLDPNEFLIR